MKASLLQKQSFEIITLQSNEVVDFPTQRESEFFFHVPKFKTKGMRTTPTLKSYVAGIATGQTIKNLIEKECHAFDDPGNGKEKAGFGLHGKRQNPLKF